MELGPLLWEHRVLATGPPGKSQIISLNVSPLIKGALAMLSRAFPLEGK